MYLKTHRLVGAAAAGCALVLGAASAAYAASIDTNAVLGTTSAAPTTVSVGSNAFNIQVWATGTLASGKTGEATVTNTYTMASDGTVTASTDPGDQTTLYFTPDYNYNGCPTTGAPQGCPSNPFVVAATLVVAPGTASGTAGTLTVSDIGSEGLGAGTPGTGYVQVGGTSANHAPSDSGAPHLDAGSTTPNNTGTFTVDWAPSTDPDTSDTVSYTLQKQDADDTSWTTVASNLTTNSYSFTGEPEGSWRYQVQAVDNHGAASNWASDSSPIVKVDTSAPYAPVITSPASPAYTDTAGDNWYKTSVQVTFDKDTSTTSNGDPVLADTSAGSGVTSVTPPTTLDSTDADATTGAISTTGYATDAAGNQSTGTTFSGYLDWKPPVVSCPTTTPTVYLNDPNATLSWTASDPAPASGLASASSGTVAVDTSAVGSHKVTIPAGAATDNVGHMSDATTCSYQVSYVWNGFLQPINDTAHFIGETTSIFKAGSTVPVKFQLTDALGNIVQTVTAPVWLTPSQGAALPSTATTDEATYTDTATPGGSYRWDSTAQQYIYNWKTAKTQAGRYWHIGVQLDDGTVHWVSIGLTS